MTSLPDQSERTTMISRVNPGAEHRVEWWEGRGPKWCVCGYGPETHRRLEGNCPPASDEERAT